MEDERDYEPLELQKMLYDILENAWLEFGRKVLDGEALVCDESGRCSECPWSNEVGCQLEHFELVIMSGE